MKLRPVFFWCHLAVGLTVGIVIAFLAITGGILTFQPQIQAFAERKAHIPHQTGAHCLAPSAILTAAAQSQGVAPTSWTLFSEAARPAEISFPKEGLLLVDPCNGQVLDAHANALRSFFQEVKELHRAVAWGGVRHDNLRAVKNAINLAFVFLLVSGLVLWFPKKLTWKHTKVGLVPRWNGLGRASEWSLHTVVGFWIAIPIVCITLSGAVLAYTWANSALYRIAGDPMPQARGEREAKVPEILPVARYGELDALVPAAAKVDPNWKVLTLRIPPAKGKEITIGLDASSYGGHPATRTQVVLNRKNASFVRADRYMGYVRARRWRLNARYLHTGELYGLPGQIIAFVTMMGTLLLVCTGFSLSIRRFTAWRNRTKRKKQLAQAKMASAEVLV
jgi:uncharacterized iron-regulated membrane protein